MRSRFFIVHVRLAALLTYVSGVRLMRIELVGGLGVGKSTLCNALDKIGFNSIYETLQTNPFLADCFADPENFRFPSQMWFALSKFQEIRKFERGDRINVLDQSVLNVRAYTNLLFGNQDGEALKIINDCFSYLEARLGPPDLLINLLCTPEEQLRRIRLRNRDHERNVTQSYVTSLQNEMNLLLGQARQDGIPVLDIDTQEIYLPDNFAYAESLANKISTLMQIDLSRFFDNSVPRQYSLVG